MVSGKELHDYTAGYPEPWRLQLCLSGVLFITGTPSQGLGV